MMKKYLLFDLDRTLWDFDGNAERTFRDMYSYFKLDEVCHVDYETFHERYREINDMLWEAYRNGTLTKEVLYTARFSLTLEAFGLQRDSIQVSRLSREMGDYYVQYGTQQTGLMPGARELLEWIAGQQRFTMAVITNGFSEAQRPKMKTAGIDRYFQYCFLSEELGFMKPDRRFFDAALQQMQARADECLVIGDDYKVDIAGAAAAGMEQVFYNYKGVVLEPQQKPATYEISHLLQLKEILTSAV